MTPDPVWSLPELTDADQALLACIATRSEFQAGDEIIREGTRPRALFAVVRGQVRVETQRGGRTREMARPGPGAVLGEISFATGDPATASVTAVEPCELACITPDALEEAARAEPD